MKKIRVGIFGAGRGIEKEKNLMMLDCDIVAICDSYEERREKALKIVGNTATVYEDFDSFIEHDMDAVVLANYFHEHVPYAIKCFERVIQLSPDYPYAYYSLGMAYEQKGDTDKALEYYTRKPVANQPIFAKNLNKGTR